MTDHTDSSAAKAASDALAQKLFFITIAGAFAFVGIVVVFVLF